MFSRSLLFMSLVITNVAHSSDYCVVIKGTGPGRDGTTPVSKYHVTCNGLEVATREQVFTISRKANEERKAAFIGQMAARKLVHVSTINEVMVFRTTPAGPASAKSYCLLQTYDPRHNTGPYFLSCSAGGLKEVTVAQADNLLAHLRLAGYQSLGSVGPSYRLFAK